MIHKNIKDFEKEHKNAHPKYEYFKKTLVSREDALQCVVSIYEIPPLKSAVPYHYHTKNEESFLILSGSGIVETKTGIKEIIPGDFLYFPANESGAHKITNTSETEMLVYIDFDTANDLEVSIYPKKNKIGIWGMGINKIFRSNDDIDYYEDE